MNHRICIVAEDYPSEGNPSYPFVQQLAYSLSNEGFECSVIAPQSITKALIRHENKHKKEWDYNPENKRIAVYRPYVATFSNTKNKWLNKFSNFLYERAIERTLKQIGDIGTVYCYFWRIGLITAKAMRGRSDQLIVQASECSIDVTDEYRTNELIGRVDGVVCASKKNYDESLAYGLIKKNGRTVVIPNGFRKDEFFKMNKDNAREELGFDKTRFIVAFVGEFSDRKGSQRLSQAIDRYTDVYSIFIGKGNMKPACKNILFQGTVAHNELCKYLNCADVFVLPTKAEGCCNAIIEAVACGLPVISSNKSFNNEILDDSYSIRINEENIEEIYEAIRLLKTNNDLYQKMEKQALEASLRFEISNRAKAVAQFILDERSQK